MKISQQLSQSFSMRAETTLPLFPSNSGIPGLFYPTLGFYDDTGRFFTTGFRVKF